MDQINAFPEHISTTVMPVTLPEKPDALEYAARNSKSVLASFTSNPTRNVFLSCFVKTIVSGVEQIAICLGGALSHLTRCSIIEWCWNPTGAPDLSWNPLHLDDTYRV
ncbi:hypothetical protein TNCV_1294051 [Trichonephila clavipes]|nr:hypothetical protein TNCV_1294051 [Trichonephila clavipes]